MRMPQPVGGDRRIDARSLGRGLDDVVDAALGDGEHPRRSRGIAAELAQIRGEIGGDQDVARLVALADDGKLRLAGVARDDLRPSQAASSETRSAPK